MTPVFFVKGDPRLGGPKTNAERHRDFRERNPDYYRLLQAKRRAKVNEHVEIYKLHAMLFKQREPLMLPAPVETIELPAMTTIPAIREAEFVAVR